MSTAGAESVVTTSQIESGLPLVEGISANLWSGVISGETTLSAGNGSVTLYPGVSMVTPTGGVTEFFAIPSDNVGVPNAQGVCYASDRTIWMSSGSTVSHFIYNP